MAAADASISRSASVVKLVVESDDRIWRIDLQDDHESCHPVGFGMTLTS
jgi:hypothetical protein